MLIGNTIIGLAKLTRLIKLSKSKSLAAKNRIHPSLFSIFNLVPANTKRSYPKNVIKFGETANPVPEELVAMLFLKSLKSIEFANNNSSAKKGFAAIEAAKKTSSEIPVILR